MEETMATKTVTLKPLHDRIVVEAEAREEKTAGGIILPDSAQEKPMIGIVAAVGTGKVLENGKVVPLEVKVGDKVLYGKYAGTEVKVDGEKFLIMQERELLGVFNK
jgi:chaperonin GroES